MKKLAILIPAFIVILLVVAATQLGKNFIFTDTVASGVMGTVLLGPTCPVERIPPDPHCAPRPYQTPIEISRAGSKSIMKRIKSDASGAFKISLAPGSYELQPKGGSPLPSCFPVAITVEPNAFAKANLSCDTGIR